MSHRLRVGRRAGGWRHAWRRRFDLRHARPLLTERALRYARAQKPGDRECQHEGEEEAVAEGHRRRTGFSEHPSDRQGVGEFARCPADLQCNRIHFQPSRRERNRNVRAPSAPRHKLYTRPVSVVFQDGSQLESISAQIAAGAVPPSSRAVRAPSSRRLSAGFVLVARFRPAIFARLEASPRAGKPSPSRLKIGLTGTRKPVRVTP